MFFGLIPRHVTTSDETIHQNCSEERKMSYNKFRQKNIEKYIKITLQQLAHKPYILCRQPYCSLECRISRSTATLRSTGSVDSTGRKIGITPVVINMENILTLDPWDKFKCCISSSSEILCIFCIPLCFIVIKFGIKILTVELWGRFKGRLFSVCKC